MNLTLNKVVRPWSAGRNLNDFRDGTNATKKFQKQRRAYEFYNIQADFAQAQFENYYSVSVYFTLCLI